MQRHIMLASVVELLYRNSLLKVELLNSWENKMTQRQTHFVNICWSVFSTWCSAAT